MKHPKLTWLGASLVVHLLVRLRVVGRERIPPAPVVVVCNHISWIDPLLIIAALGRDRRIVFLAAREHIQKRRVLDAIVDWLGITILIDRASVHQRETLRAANEALRSGSNLVLFPEGKINFTDEVLLPLQSGTAAIARRAGAWIVPLGVAGSREMHLGRRITLAVGTPIASGVTRRDDDAVTERLREELLAALPPTPPPSRWQPGSWMRRLT